MKKQKNRMAISTVCLIQVVVCGGLLLGIFLWKLVGGTAYDAVAQWYREAIQDSILVYPDESLPVDEASHA